MPEFDARNESIRLKFNLAPGISNADDVIDTCAAHYEPPLPSMQYKTEYITLTSSAHDDKSKMSHSVTLVTQVSMDRLSVLEKTLSTWNGPISLAVYVPVKNITEGLVEWQR